MLSIFSKTDIGKVRKVNQDAVKTEVISDNLAWSVVCDGMGGQAGGDIASNMAVIMCCGQKENRHGTHTGNPD